MGKLKPKEKTMFKPTLRTTLARPKLAKGVLNTARREGGGSVEYST